MTLTNVQMEAIEITLVDSIRSGYSRNDPGMGDIELAEREIHELKIVIARLAVFLASKEIIDVEDLKEIFSC